jgi:hypothetical protein
MGNCKAWKDHTHIVCGEETPPGFAYCEEHKTRRGAANERTTNEISNVVDAADIFTGDPLTPDKPDDGVQEDKKAEVAKKEKAQTPVTVNRAQQVVQRCFEMLDRATEFEQEAWDQVVKLPKEQWRYVDKTGGEQLRSEISVHERAMDRTLRAVTAVAKLNIDAQAVNINKVVKEMIKGVVMRVFQRMELDQQQIDQARRYLAEEFEKVGQAD